MAREGDNDNDEYYVPIQTISGQIFVNPNRFCTSSRNCTWSLKFSIHCFPTKLTTSFNKNHQKWIGNVSIFKATMDHMDLISCNSDGRYIDLTDPRILAAETSQKDNLYLGKAIKADDCEDFMIIPKSSLPTSAHIIRLLWIFKRKRNPFR